MTGGLKPGLVDLCDWLDDGYFSQGKTTDPLMASQGTKPQFSRAVIRYQINDFITVINTP